MVIKLDFRLVFGVREKGIGIGIEKAKGEEGNGWNKEEQEQVENTGGKRRFKRMRAPDCAWQLGHGCRAVHRAIEKTVARNKGRVKRKRLKQKPKDLLGQFEVHRVDFFQEVPVSLFVSFQYKYERVGSDQMSFPSPSLPLSQGGNVPEPAQRLSLRT